MKPLDAIGPIDVSSSQHVEWQSPAQTSPEKIDAISTPEKVDQARVDAEKEAEREKVKQITDRLNRMSNLFSRKIQFEVPWGSEDVIVKIIDRETGRVIRQIPPPELVKLAARMEEIYAIIFRTES